MCVYKVPIDVVVGGVIGDCDSVGHACRRFLVSDEEPETIAKTFERSNLAVLVVPDETVAEGIRRHTSRPVVTTMEAAKQYAWSTPEANARRVRQSRSVEGVHWVSNRRRIAAIERLASMLPPDVTAIAGIGRSGVAPALMIAEMLHLHASIINEQANLTTVPHGWRFCKRGSDTGSLVILDDTVATGRSMKAVRSAAKRLDREILFAAVFCSPEQLPLVDVYAEALPLPHYLQWNIFNSVHTRRMAVDFDGVLCEDCPPDVARDPQRYAEFLEGVRPIAWPRRERLPAIITARLEKHRGPTEAWLARWGIQTRRLIMARNVDEHRNPASFKAAEYNKLRADLYLESDPRQAAEIASLTNKRVICPPSGEVFN